MNLNTDQTVKKLTAMKLHGMASFYEGVLTLSAQDQPDPHELAASMADTEQLFRNDKRAKALFTLAKLRYHATLEQVHCSVERNLTKEILSRLADGSYIKRAENILVSGATGCGKSFLACALGRQACLLGYRVLYLSVNKFIERLTLAKLEGSYIKFLKSLERIDVLILDDFGIQVLDQVQRIAMLQILEDRYKIGPVIITSQLEVAGWYATIGDPTIADGVMDRLTAQAHRVQLKGPSLRKNQSL